MTTFARSWVEAVDIDEAIDDWISIRTAGLGNLGYSPTMQGERTIAYRRRFTPGIAIVLGVLTFPIGIAFWVLWKREQVFTVHFAPEGASTRVTAQGDAREAAIERVRTAEWEAYEASVAAPSDAGPAVRA